MIKTDGPGLFLPASDCALLDKALRDALQYAWLGRRAIPPHALVVLADAVHTTAEEYRPPEYRPGDLTSGTGTASAPTTSTSTTSELEEVPLSTPQAAELLGFTESYVRRLARKSAIPAETGAGDTGWKFRRNELTAWKAHREEIKRKAA